MTQRTSNLLVWAGTIVFVVAVSVLGWAGHPVNADSIFNLAVLALPLAGIYAMYASGLVVVYTTTGIFNFAQGGIGMFCAYVCWQMTDKTTGWGWPMWLAIPVVVLGVAPLIGVTLDRTIMRHLQGKPLVVQLMVTVGLMFAFIGLANMIWNQGNSHTLPHILENEGFKIANVPVLGSLISSDVTVTWHRFITVVIAILLAIGLRLLLFRTRLGIAMRAVVDNRDLAALEGARSSNLSSFAWALGCSLAALAGILVAPEAGMQTAALTLFIITAFSAAVVGRLRSLPLTYLGAIILALAKTYSELFLQFSGRWSNVSLALPTILLFIVLLLLPRAELKFARVTNLGRIDRVSTPRDTAIGMAVFLVFIMTASYFVSDTNISRFSLGMCTALVALSLVPLIGWTGQVSLAPLAFAGIGAVAYSHFGGQSGNVTGVIAAVIVTIPIGALLALPAMRLQGLYLALATLAFAAMVEQIFYTQPFAVGFGTRFVERLQIGPLDFSSRRSFLFLVTLVFGLCAVGIVALRRSAFGRRLVALRDSEAASVTVGVNVFETKVAVFSLSAGMAGFAGAFFAMQYESLNAAKNFEMVAGLPIVLALVIGGVGFVAGALFAGVFGLVTVMIQENWHISLWLSLIYLAPGLAVLGIIQNPRGAVVPIGEGFARLLPWRHDARLDYEEQKAADAEPEVGVLGLERGFDEADVLLIDRELGVSNELAEIGDRR